MPDDLIREARKQVRNVYGEVFETKASDELVLKLARPPVEFLGAAETAARTFDLPQPAVIELKAEPPPSPRGRAETVRPEGLEEVGRMLGGTGEAGRLVAAELRRRQIREARDSFHRRVAPLRDVLERSAAEPGAAEGGFLGGGAAQPFTEVCWLNQTMRTGDVSDALAEVAADETVERMDLPRLLVAEVRETAAVINAPAFRDHRGLTGAGVVVAVIDSEVARQHPAFGGRVEQRANFTREPFGSPGSHGTAVAGIIGSTGPDFVGIAPGATIFNYKVLATDRRLNADDFGGALAIQQALEDGVQVANCSWGAGPVGSGTSREARACDAAWTLGMVIVKSAGNRGPGRRTLTTPADAEGIIVVGATDRRGRGVERYSSRGPTGDGRHRPHLVAPGGEIQGFGISSCLTAGGFGDAGVGTSFAAPHVTGMIALLLEENPDAAPDELRDLLLSLCSPLEGQLDEDTQGRGLPLFTLPEEDDQGG